MREKEIKDKFWKLFMTWMRGQTVSTYPDGEIDYYDHDVEAFFRKFGEGYDRQEDPYAWD